MFAPALFLSLSLISKSVSAAVLVGDSCSGADWACTTSTKSEGSGAILQCVGGKFAFLDDCLDAPFNACTLIDNAPYCVVGKGVLGPSLSSAPSVPPVVPPVQPEAQPAPVPPATIPDSSSGTIASTASGSLLGTPCSEGQFACGPRDTSKNQDTVIACQGANFIAAYRAGILGAKLTAQQVDIATKTILTGPNSGKDYFSVNPRGNVPAIVLESGTCLTENSATLQWIVDNAVTSVGPKIGTQKSFQFVNDNELADGRTYLIENEYSVADSYLYFILVFIGLVGIELASFPVLKTYFDRLERLAVHQRSAVSNGNSDDGTGVNQNAATLQWILDNAKTHQVGPANGTGERYVLQSKLSYASSELHGVLHDLFSPAPRSLSDGRKYWVGTDFSVADAYLYFILVAIGLVGLDLGQFKSLKVYFDSLKRLEFVQEAHAFVEQHDRKETVSSNSQSKPKSVYPNSRNAGPNPFKRLLTFLFARNRKSKA
ncbi:hypothetical protein BDR26DRAFT_919307 [Obelidium mucronatum]|nr:hypothetical protein BDR26DRAFT_919307 [Obelidium mucronatum]